MEMMMSGSDKRARLASEEAQAVAAMQAERTASRISIRSARASSKAPSKPSDGFDLAADRLEARAHRDAADRKAHKAKAKRDAEVAATGVGPKVQKGIKIVPDPYQPGETIPVVVNLAEHPLEMMLARRRLDQALYEAGVRFRRIYEAAEIGPGRGIDPGKIKVDGGRYGDPLSDSVVHAQFELRRLAGDLGLVGERIVSAVAGQGSTVAELARRWPGPEDERTKRDYLTMRLKEALKLLAEEVWGAKGPARGRIAGARGLGTGHVDEQAVATANQTYLRKRGIAL
ncbi:MAG: hypothetical protein EOP19_22645 [Hyphomicrobiales bacterium]|nr:MAG: hypothetical protein EOP19_22645 [Hyphomicrobiales bacterium]